MTVLGDGSAPMPLAMFAAGLSADEVAAVECALGALGAPTDTRPRFERAEAELEKVRKMVEIQGNVSALLVQMLDTEGATARKRTRR